ncbi:MAG: cysteine hydrolase family protein [Candidatus Thorarchaeota archaeon]
MTLPKLDPEYTALIIIDMLNDFVEEDGALVVPVAKELVPTHVQILNQARKKGLTVIYLTDNHMPDDEEFKVWPKHSVAGTRGAQVVDELAPGRGEKVIPKRRYSGFFGTDLDLTLREAGITNIILVGVLTEICVMYTSADASARGYNVYVVADGTGSTVRENHQFALQHMKEVHNTIVVTSNQVLNELL